MNECHLAAFAALLLLIIKDHNQVDNRPCCPLKTMCDRGGRLTKANLSWVICLNIHFKC